MEIIVNGEPRTVEPPITVAELVAQLSLAGKRIAVERNGEIVPRSQHDRIAIDAGDRLEVVVAVGGG
jgi:sulfur carrier protein